MDKLFEQFSSVSKLEWLAKIEKDLKGKSLSSLDWTIQKEFSVSPFSHADDLPVPPTPLTNASANNQWEIGTRVVVKNWKTANQEALLALENGATAIGFVLNESPSKKELETFLAGIELEWISTNFISSQPAWKRFLRTFASYLQRKKYDSQKIAGSFSFTGNFIKNKEEAKLWNEIAAQLPNMSLFTVNGRQYYGGTEHIIDELTDIIQKGNSYLETLDDYQMPLSKFAPRIQFSLTLDDSYLLNVAKIRALKLLWLNVLDAWKITDKTYPSIEIHINDNSNSEDENYNKIKATSQALSAVIGGIKRLYVYPSDQFKDGVGTPFAQRIALNIQHLLQLESYMDRVTDPAAGSYYLETLTNELAERVWRRLSGC